MRSPLATLLAVLALLGGAVLVALALVGTSATLPDVSALARRAPARTALMRQRAREARAAGRGYRIDQRWIPYERISPLLRRAVLIAEDDAFFSHDGMDWNEIRASVRRNLEAGRIVRGGSTITQQLARNLYLGNAPTLTRKLQEMVLARRLERALTKRRIFELYLNLIEWGDGVFGIEAAARRDFGVSAADLDPRQAALLAAVIINPHRYDPVRPAPRIQHRMRMILSRMVARGYLSENEYRRAIGEPAKHGFFDWLFGGPAAAPPTSPPAPGSPAGSGAADTASAPADSAGW